MDLSLAIIFILKFSAILMLVVIVSYIMTVTLLYLIHSFNQDFSSQRDFFYRLFQKNSRYTILKIYPEKQEVDVDDGQFFVTLSIDYKDMRILHNLSQKNPDALISFYGIVDKKKMNIVHIKGFSLKKKGE